MDAIEYAHSKNSGRLDWVYRIFLPSVYTRVISQKTEQLDFWGLCSDQQLSFFTLLDRASFLHYNNTKIIKFG